MNIASLHAFLAVADTGSFSHAAGKRFVTQPAISKRIAALEHELGTRLFDRIGRRVALTPAGIALRERAHGLISELMDIERAISNLSGAIAGELRIATSHHIGLHRLPPALKSFNQRYPDVNIDLRFMDSEQGCQAVARGDIELAVVTLPRAPLAALKTRAVWDDPLDVVVAREHALARKRKLTKTDLLQHPAILPGPGTYTRELILNALGARSDLRIGMASNYLEVLKMLVSIGLGWSALPRTLIDDEVKVVHIQNMRMTRVLGIVTHRARTLSNAGRAFCEIVGATGQ